MQQPIIYLRGFQTIEPQSLWPALAPDTRRKVGMVCAKCGNLSMHSRRWYWPLYVALLGLTLPFFIMGNILAYASIPLYLVMILDLLTNRMTCPRCRSSRLVKARTTRGMETWIRFNPPRI